VASVADTLNLALSQHQSGRFDLAEPLYRQILQSDPNNFQAVHLLGLVAQQTGRSDEALHLLSRAVQLRPDSSEAHYNHGIILKTAGRVEEAVVSYQQALRLKPNSPEALNNLGEALLSLGRQNEAVASLRQALVLKPNYSGALNNLGIAFQEQNNPAGAVACYRQAIHLRPGIPDTYNNLGIALADQGELEEACACYQQALQLRPHYPEAQNNLGIALRLQGKLNEAERCHRQALLLKPEYAGAHEKLATVLREQGRIEEALASCREAIRLRPSQAESFNTLALIRQEQGQLEEALAALDEALRLNPDFPHAHNNRGNVLGELGRLNEAVDSYRHALRLKPDFSEAHVHLGMTLLLKGDFAEGWSEYEWRRRYKMFDQSPSPDRAWDGGDVNGQTILLIAEQGLGDTLQFLRYASLLKQRGARVLLGCQPSLSRLLANAPCLDGLIISGSAVPFFDVYSHLLSLPRLFGTTSASNPSTVPYLFADPALVKQWHQDLKALGGFKVGIAWQANPAHDRGRRRSAPLTEFAPLAQVPGVTLVSLQKGAGAEQLGAKNPFPIVNLSDRLDETAGPFMDTAAVMKNLDLVVTIDSAVGHLAGGLGVPVWVALPSFPDWRWLQHGEQTAWYPTMRLFRQTATGDWSGVFQRMASELHSQLSSRMPHKPLFVETSAGDLLDRLSILEIKSERISDATRLRNVRIEVASLTAVRQDALPSSPELADLAARLKRVNERLWEIEDAIRQCESDQDFGPRFIELARSVYHENDHRAALKRAINELLQSRIVEEKSYREYRNDVP
jgi:Flp pilus assembly protein TadD